MADTAVKNRSTAGMIEATLNQAADIIRETILMNTENPGQRQAVALWGPPGIGKTKLPQAICREMTIKLNKEAKEGSALRTFNYKSLIAAYHEPTTIIGMPYVEHDEQRGRLTAFAPLKDVLPWDGEGILHIDEPNRAPTLTQNILMELTQEYAINGSEYVLPPGWNIILSANNEGDGGGLQRTPLALCNRILHIFVTVSPDEWCDWAVANGVHPMVIAFHRWRQSAEKKDQILHNFDGASKNKAFPTPRSWENISKYVHRNIKNKELRMITYAGLIGSAAAMEFYGFEKFFAEMPSIEQIMLDPQKAPLPHNPSSMYAVCATLATKLAPTNFDQISTYLERLPEEYNVMTVRDALRKDDAIGKIPGFVEWGQKHKAVLF